MIAIYIRYDSSYDEYHRRSYSLMELLRDIGGLQQSLYIIGFVIVTFIAKRIFISDLLTHIYQIKNVEALVRKNQIKLDTGSALNNENVGIKFDEEGSPRTA